MKTKNSDISTKALTPSGGTSTGASPYDVIVVGTGK